ncbi:hypothetical protein KFL_001000200 [Klebsormidium nitens]|uniref:Uncharacterized protein n=1 Tax=Klebsormidium nitens TaxID=105231 RepID=A0A1Y1I1U0_KLENI|nr:hypothetical protein KFL_001000200 [Klebsormidium nitens]|eukprot:GAQ82098.1 hypothetical protein KFL_001000200 [Klebsormidium nitens]
MQSRSSVWYRVNINRAAQKAGPDPGSKEGTDLHTSKKRFITSENAKDKERSSDCAAATEILRAQFSFTFLQVLSMSVAKEPPLRQRPLSPGPKVTPLMRKLANQHVIRAAENLLKMADTLPAPCAELESASEALPATSKLETAELKTETIKEEPPPLKLPHLSSVSSQNRLERRRSNLKTQISKEGAANSVISPPMSPRKNVQWREHHETKIFRRSPEPSEDPEEVIKGSESASEERDGRDGATSPSDNAPSSSGHRGWWEGLERVLGTAGRVLYHEVALLAGHMPLQEHALGHSLQHVADTVSDECHRLLTDAVPEWIYEQISADVDELAGRFAGLAVAMNGADEMDRGDLVIAAAAIAAVGAEAEEQMRTLVAGMPLTETELAVKMQAALDAINEVATENAPSERHAFLHASVTSESERMCAMFENLVVAANNDKEADPREKLLAQALGALSRTMEGAFTAAVLPMEAVKLDGKMRRMVEFGVEWLRREARTKRIPSEQENGLLAELRRRAEPLASGYRAKNVAARLPASSEGDGRS